MPETPHPVDLMVGARVRDRRIRLGYNQTDLGRALGLTFQQVQKYEKGSNRISASKLVEIAAFLKVKPSDFLDDLTPDAEAPDAVTISPRLMRALQDMPAIHMSLLADMAAALTPRPTA